MSTNDETKNYYVYIGGVKVPVTEEIYRAYYRPVWAAKKRAEREKRCRNANGNRCVGDCENCEWEPDGNVLSLDKFAEEGFEAADPVDIDELVMEKLLMDELYAALDELTDDERSLIDALYYKERSERDVAAERGVQRNTVVYHKNKILDKLKNILRNL